MAKGKKMGMARKPMPPMPPSGAPGAGAMFKKGGPVKSYESSKADMRDDKKGQAKMDKEKK